MAQAKGFFTDTSVCIGCKACEVACREWNQLTDDQQQYHFLADSFDNTGKLDALHWRHVKFIEPSSLTAATTVGDGQAWLMMSDVCKHCQHASCLEVCPTNAIVRTEFDTVFIQQETCNGCRNCISACPYGVIGFSEKTGTARKCTLCYDRLQNDMTPACAKVCPTQSIQFGNLTDLQATADKRLAQLRQAGYGNAQLYGRDTSVYGGLNAFFLLMDKPAVYGLPTGESAQLPSRNNVGGYVGGLIAAALAVVGGMIAIRRRRERPGEPEPEREETHVTVPAGGGDA